MNRFTSKIKNLVTFQISDIAETNMTARKDLIDTIAQILANNHATLNKLHLEYISSESDEVK